jgi:predicted metal-dependent peptidase
MSDAAQSIMAARVLAQIRWPYISHLLFSLRLVAVENGSLKTMAVDAAWRLYFNPDFVLSQNVDSLATVLQHEAMHCMLTHSSRFEQLRDPEPDHKIFNVAADCGINHVIENAGFSFQETFRPVRFTDFDDVNETMSTEQVYCILKEKATESGSSPDPNGSTAPAEASEPAGLPEPDGSSAPTEVSEPAGSPNPDGSTASTEDYEADPTKPPKEDDGHQEDSHDCGSVVGGFSRGYEIPLDDLNAPGATQETQVVVISQVAADITQYAKNSGSLPAGLSRWADEWLNPKVNWRRQLAVRVRASLATKSGRRDYSMMRPSRREQGLSQGDVQLRLPSMRQPANPKTKVVVDTSGSITADALKVALSEVMGILKAVGNSDGLYIIPCDSEAYPAQLVRTPRDLKQLTFPGGGGTDMGAGLSAAVETKPKPDVVVVITDGLTPWPDEKPRGCDNFILVVTYKGGLKYVPDWAKTIFAEDLN